MASTTTADAAVALPEQLAPQSSPQRQAERDPGSTSKYSDRQQESNRQKTWCGKYELGKWYCSCSRGLHEAAVYTTTKPGPDRGKKCKAKILFFNSSVIRISSCQKLTGDVLVVWRCPVRDRREQCPFFIWLHEEDDARKWLRETYPENYLGSPVKQVDPQTRKPTFMENWASTSKKRSFDAADEEGTVNGKKERMVDDLYNVPQGGTPHQVQGREGRPSKRLRKSSRVEHTPGQSFIQRLEACKTSLPTPDTNRREVEQNPRPRVSPSRETRSQSPTPFQLRAAIDLVGEGEPRRQEDGLFETVMGLVREDGASLKTSTQIMIQHVVEQELGRSRAEARGYKRTIRKLMERVDDLETALGNLLPDDAAIVFSD